MKALLVMAVLATPAAAAPCHAPGAVAHEANLDGERVRVCFDQQPRACWRLDLARPAWVPVVAFTRPASDRPPTIPSSVIVTACAPDGSACHTVATPTTRGLRIVTDKSGEVAAVEEQRITVADSIVGRIWSTILPWPHVDDYSPWSFTEVQFIGPDYLLVEYGEGGARLARVFGTTDGKVVRELPGSFARAPVVSLRDELVLATTGGAALLFVDTNQFSMRTLPLFADPKALALFAATPHAIVAVQDGGDGTVAVSNGRSTTLVPGPPACKR